MVSDVPNIAALQDELRRRLVTAATEAAGLGDLSPRVFYYLQWLANIGALQAGRQLVDLGSGLSPFGPAAATFGMRVTLLDDFAGGGGVDRERREETQQRLETLRSRLGLRVLEQDYLTTPLPIESASVDVVTLLHTLEHCHHSPKRAFAEVVRVLKPGGHVIIATPNSVNLRKRLFVLIGHSNLASIYDWYLGGDPNFRGHVREPTVGELQWLLEQNGLDLIATEGRNFIGRQSRALPGVSKQRMARLVDVADGMLRRFPTWCSDIHVVGRKPVA